jgi:hypothetical protein
MRGRTCMHRAAASGQADALLAVKARGVIGKPDAIRIAWTMENQGIDGI